MSDEKVKLNCTNCIRFTTCKYVEKNKAMAKEMYGMFEYLEWNNLEKIFHANAGACMHYIHEEESVDKLKKKIQTAKYQMDWIKSYIANPNDRLEPAFIVEQLKRITAEYLEALNK